MESDDLEEQQNNQSGKEAIDGGNQWNGDEKEEGYKK